MRQFFAFVLLWFMLLPSPTLNAQTQSQTIDNNQAFATLADIIDNPEQRQELVHILRELSQSSNEPSTENENTKPTTQSSIEETDGEDTFKSVTEGTKAAVASAVSLPSKLAFYTSEIAAQVGESLTNAWQSLIDITQGKDLRLKYLNKDIFKTVLINLAIIIATTIILFQTLRRLSRPLKKRLSFWVQSSDSYKPIIRNILAVGLTALMDALLLGLTYLIANSVAIYAIGEFGAPSVQMALVINAFLMIEAIKIAARLVFYPYYTGLRLLPSKNEVAHYWYRWLANMINIIGYGYLVCVPLVNLNLSKALGKALLSIIAIGAFIYGVTFVWRNRHRVSQALINISNNGREQALIITTFLRTLSHIWHWLAIGYLMVLLIVTLLQPERALPFIMHATIVTIASIGGGLLLSTLLTQLIGHRIELSSEFNRKLPGVEARLNAYIPVFLRIIRLVLTIFVVLIALSAWGIFDLSAWLQSDAGSIFISRWASVFVIIVMAFLLWLIVSGIIEHRLSENTGSGRPTARTQTLLSLFKNALAISIIAVTTMIVLSEIGINIGPLIAGAGVLGLAIGFGAQTLVHDVITGIFIQIENAMNTDDIVNINGTMGTVENISIRSVGLRDISGTYHLIPFSSVSMVSNYNRGYAYHLEEYGIAYREDIDEAIEVLKQAFEELSQNDKKRVILEPITIAGVTKLDNSSVNIRVSIKTVAGEQWRVGRAFNRLVKIHFDRAGIEMPFPHLTMYFGQGKQGEAAPANLRLMRQSFDIDGNPTPITQEKPSHQQPSLSQQHPKPHLESDKDNPEHTQTPDKRENNIGDVSEIRVAPKPPKSD